MVQLNVLSGSKAGDVYVARRFPVRVGRGAASHLKLEDAGVWDEHLQIRLERHKGFILEPHADARTMVNGETVSEATLLRNGDQIQLGGATLRFWLAEARQQGLGARETCVWLGIILITLSQIALIYYLSL